VPKSARWTIYVAIMIGVIGFGYYTTLNKPAPDHQRPAEAPASSSEQHGEADEIVEDTDDGGANGAYQPD
jgi:hypothetical protein